MRHPLSVDGTGLNVLDGDYFNSSGDYSAYLCITTSVTALHHKRKSIADQFHLRRHTAGTNYKNEACWLNSLAARRAWIIFVS
jgi:hypothetical protein